MSRTARFAAFIGAAIAWSAAAIMFSWLIGRVFTDSYFWTQWLWWIPTPAVLVVAVLGLLTAFGPSADPRRRRQRLIRWGFCGFLIVVYFSAFEHRFFRGMSAMARNGAIKIVHWNVEPAVWRNMEPSIEKIIQLDGDITILTNPAGIHFHEQTVAWMGEDRTALTTGLMAVISRVPVRTIRPVVMVDEMFVSVVEFESSHPFDRPLVMYLIDMPSDPQRGRMAIARRVRAMLDERRLPPPDVVIGDFNIPRGSASLAVMFPGMTHAFQEAGHGYGATYYRPWPLYHIDHALLGENVTALRYDVVEAGISRHRAQIIWLAPRRR